LLIFFLLNLHTFSRYIQLCVDCEKKLNAALRFQKTCLAGENLRKIKPAPVKRQVVPPVQAKKSSVRVVAKKVIPDEVALQESIEIDSSISNEKKPKISNQTIDESTADVAECVENPPEDGGIANVTRPAVRRIGCPICKMNVDQSELEYHINLHVLHIHKAKTKPKFPYIELPLDKNGKKRYQCQFEGCGAILTTWQVHMVSTFK
jgi:hypothetical protein